MMKIVLLLLAIVLGVGLARHFMTAVRFNGVKASVSSLYCRRIGNTTEKPVIFLPGIKGSLLSQDGKRAWLSLPQLIRNTAPFLYDASTPLQPVGVMTRISIIPGFFAYQPYQRIVSHLACNPNAYFFSYDWRRPSQENAADLWALVERVRQETGQKPSIVAHSMGGLLTHAVMKEHADAVDKVVYVGVPFKPGIGFLDDLNAGAPTGRNKTIMSKGAVFSHPSSLVLLPHAGERLYKNRDLQDVQTWREEKLSVFADGNADEAAFARNLELARDFHQTLDTPAAFDNQVLFVVGNCQETTFSANTDGSIVKEKGDGRVNERSAFPVEFEQMNKTVFYSCARHDQQLNNKENVRVILEFLR